MRTRSHAAVRCDCPECVAQQLDASARSWATIAVGACVALIALPAFFSWLSTL